MVTFHRMIWAVNLPGQITLTLVSDGNGYTPGWLFGGMDLIIHGCWGENMTTPHLIVGKWLFPLAAHLEHNLVGNGGTVHPFSKPLDLCNCSKLYSVNLILDMA